MKPLVVGSKFRLKTGPALIEAMAAVARRCPDKGTHFDYGLDLESPEFALARFEVAFIPKKDDLGIVNSLEANYLGKGQWILFSWFIPTEFINPRTVRSPK